MQSPFASSSIRIHIARGACAALFGVVAMLSLQTSTLLGAVGGIAALGGALFMLRGCPMCWTIGLFETVAARVGRRADAKLPGISR